MILSFYCIDFFFVIYIARLPVFTGSVLVAYVIVYETPVNGLYVDNVAEAYVQLARL